MELGYARVSTTAQDLDRQLTALSQRGIPDGYVWSDKKTGATTDRPGLTALLSYAREGDTVVAYTLDRIGRNLRDCLNMVAQLRERGIGIKTLADPLPIDTSDDSAMAQVAVAMLGLFGEIERVFAQERAAHARAVREAKGAPVGRPAKLTGQARDAALAAVHSGMSVRQVAATHGVGKDTLYKALREERAPVGGNTDTDQESIAASSGVHAGDRRSLFVRPAQRAVRTDAAGPRHTVE